MALLPAAAIASIRRALGVTLTHTYSRAARSAGAEDAWGTETASYGTVTAGLPCRYAVAERFVRDEAGARTVSTPTLTVPADDPLDVGDRVTAITAQDGTVLLAGPLTVESVDPTAEIGASLLRVCTLRGADVRGA